MATPDDKIKHIYGATAAYRGRRRDFILCGVAYAVVYRPRICPEPIHVKRERDLPEYGGLLPFDRLVIYAIYPDGKISLEPTDVPYGSLKIFD